MVLCGGIFEGLDERTVIMPETQRPPQSPPQSHPLYVATRRLVGALDRLESNLKQAMVAPDDADHPNQQLMVFEKENSALRQERENLNAAIAKLQMQYNDLHKVASTIYGKLDDSIKRLTQIIED